jgi:hypothetical protein
MFVLIWYHEKTACANQPQQKDWETVTMAALSSCPCAKDMRFAVPPPGDSNHGWPTAKHWTFTEAFHIVPFDDLMR